MADARPTSVTRLTAATPVAQAANETPAAPVASASTARTLAAKPPVDVDRIKQIKAAVESGTFPISPAKIADQLIALRYEWMSHDPA